MGAVPKFTIRRLSLYLRELENLERRDLTTTKSQDLAASLGLTDAQVRRDFAYFGQFGRPGVGYHVRSLIDHIKTILGIQRPQQVALVGVGNLGRALLLFKGFETRGFLISAAFDSDPAKVGDPVGQVNIQPLAEMQETVSAKDIKLGILATPETGAKRACELLVQAGVTGILNFTPIRLSTPEQVAVTNVDLAVMLEGLAYHNTTID